MQSIKFRGMQAFILIYIGQLFSVLGSGLTGFALGVWVYLETGSVTQYALISMSVILPGMLIAPLAGTIVDRWDRRWVMILSDLVAGLGTLAIALLFLAGRLEIWHIYLATLVISTANTFQWPAYNASIPLLVPKSQLGRTNGMVQLAQAIGQITAPLLSGLLLATIGLSGVILIDFATFLFAMITLLVVHIPHPEPTAASKTRRDSWVQEAAYGLSYLIAKPGLFSLLILFTISNFLIGLVSVLVTPLVLSIASTTTLGMVMSVGGLGMLAGSLLMSVWGGPKRGVYSVLGFLMMEGLAITLGGLWPAVPIFMIAAFSFFFALPFVNGGSMTIWQSKVASEVQGRVFAITATIATAVQPLGYLIAGPLADRVFEPLLVPNGPLAGSIGQVIGVGPGRGIGLIFVGVGLLTTLIAAAGYLYPRIRMIDTELPDMIADKVPGELAEVG